MVFGFFDILCVIVYSVWLIQGIVEDSNMVHSNAAVVSGKRAGTSENG